jgi:hypothetical protein
LAQTDGDALVLPDGVVVPKDGLAIVHRETIRPRQWSGPDRRC